MRVLGRVDEPPVLGSEAGMRTGPRLETVRPTRICITVSSGGAGLETSAGRSAFEMVSVCPAKREKSTITSIRSAGRTSSGPPSATGLLNRPPSEPICHAGGPPWIVRFQKRAFEALRMRKRYMRGSTFKNGRTAPLTTGVSPKNSGIHVESGL
jgi:hypothetical protein